MFPNSLGSIEYIRCFKAKSNDQPNRIEINEKVAQVLHPEVEKLYRFMFFTVGF